MQKLIKPVLLIGGIFTAGPLVLAFRPQLVTTMLKLDYVEQYALLIQHWGLMVGLVGLFMIAAARIPSIRVPVVLYAVIEKIFMVGFYFQHRSEAWGPNFMPAALVDGTLSALMLMWLAHARDDVEG